MAETYTDLFIVYTVVWLVFAGYLCMLGQAQKKLRSLLEKTLETENT